MSLTERACSNEPIGVVGHNSVEPPSDDGRMESLSSTCDGKHGGNETCELHTPDDSRTSEPDGELGCQEGSSTS